MSEISQSAQKQIIKNRIKRRRRCDRISTVVMSGELSRRTLKVERNFVVDVFLEMC